MTEEILAGIDLGGTKIMSGLFDRRGSLLASLELPTPCDLGSDRVVDRMADSVYRLLDQIGAGRSELLGVVAGSPGPLDPNTGVIFETPNLPFRNLPLKDELTSRIGVPVLVENDANLAGLAEYEVGCQARYPILLYLTISTGIGGAVIMNGEIYGGAVGAAGEAGHMTILPDGPLCGCGNHGCLETLASGTAIAREAKKVAVSGRSPELLRLAGGSPERIDARLVGQAMLAGDEQAKMLMTAAFDYLGIGVANLVNVFNPHAVVLGGGLLAFHELCLERVWEQVTRRAFKRCTEELAIIPARLEKNAGLIGCQVYGARKWGDRG